MDVAALLERMTARRDYAGQLEHVEELPERAGRFAEPGAALRRTAEAGPRRAGDRAAVLAPGGGAGGGARGARLGRRHRHGERQDAVLQPADSWRSAAAPRQSRGQRGSRALYLYPTKALAQDQLKGLLELVGGDAELAAAVRPGVYDGDTPTAQRRRIRNEANLVLSNPDMLHAGILPYHPEVGRVLRRAAVRRARRGAHLPRHPRRPRVGRAAAAAARVPALRQPSRCFWPPARRSPTRASW